MWDVLPALTDVEVDVSVNTSPERDIFPHRLDSYSALLDLSQTDSALLDLSQTDSALLDLSQTDSALLDLSQTDSVFICALDFLLIIFCHWLARVAY